MLAGAAYVWAPAPETLSPLVLVAAAGMVLAHVSALVAAQGPARMGSTGCRYAAGRLRGCCCRWPRPRSGHSPWRSWTCAAPARLALGLTLLIVIALAATRLVGSGAERAGR